MKRLKMYISKNVKKIVIHFSEVEKLFTPLNYLPSLTHPARPSLRSPPPRLGIPNPSGLSRRKFFRPALAASYRVRDGALDDPTVALPKNYMKQIEFHHGEFKCAFNYCKYVW